MRFRAYPWVLCVALLLTATHVKANFSQLYIFGDSLSDTGNLASVVGTFPPPFFMNRVSNGPVAVETLATLLGLEAKASLHLVGPVEGTNYAVAGARARGSQAIDLTAQVEAFLQHYERAAPPEALYVVMMGGNDLRDARDAEDSAAQAIISQTVAAIATNIETLAAAGATIFLVVNVPDIGAIPETLHGMPPLAEIATLQTEMFNQALADEVSRLRTELALKMALVDLFHSGRVLSDNAVAYDIDNLTDPCFLIVAGAFSFHPDCENGANFDAFAYFDAFHPTAKVHEIMGRILFSFSPSPPLAAE